MNFDKDLEESFNSVNFDEYKSASFFENEKDNDKKEKELEEAFNSVNFEEYKVPIKCNCDCLENNKKINKYIIEFDDLNDDCCIDNLLDRCSLDFEDIIINRGQSYYYDNRVLEVKKDANTYFAKVLGSDDKTYNVVIDIIGDEVLYHCNCPCEYNCKHEYATLCAISNDEYDCISLKECIDYKSISILGLIEKIPAEELKRFILSSNNKGEIVFNEEKLRKYFRKYLPNQDYCYYYNNLYNSLILDNEYRCLISDYFDKIKNYISDGNNKEVFKIIKAIICAYNDANLISSNEFIDIINYLSSSFRIAYRKSSEYEINEIEKWLYELDINNYYNNLYLEDMILLAINDVK